MSKKHRRLKLQHKKRLTNLTTVQLTTEGETLPFCIFTADRRLVNLAIAAYAKMTGQPNNTTADSNSLFEQLMLHGIRDMIEAYEEENKQ